MSYKRHSASIIRTVRWKALRVLALRRDGWRCVKCSARGRLEIDHIVSVRSNPALAYELGNLQTLCSPCHSSKTREELGFPMASPARLAWRQFVKGI